MNIKSFPLKKFVRDVILPAAAITGIILLPSFAASIVGFISQQPATAGIVIFCVLTVFFALIFWLLHKPPPDSNYSTAYGDPKLEKFPTSDDPNEIYKWAVAQTEAQIRWYRNSRQAKRSGSRMIRGLAIILGALGALAPVISSIVNQSGTNITSWGYVFLAAAGACIAGDRLFGLSSGWIRYIQTEFTLQSMLTEFQYEWLIKSRDTTKTSSELSLMVETFHKSVQQIVNSETNAWAAEFQSNLSALEKQLNTSAETQKTLSDEKQKEREKLQEAEQKAKIPGSIQLIVSDALKFKSVTIKLLQDNQPVREEKLENGKQKLIDALKPGSYELALTGVKDNKTYRENRVVTVAAATMEKVEMTISET